MLETAHISRAMLLGLLLCLLGLLLCRYVRIEPTLAADIGLKWPTSIQGQNT